MVIGALAALAGVVPLTALAALIFRIPVPLVGMTGGIEGVKASAWSVLFYGFLGGFVILLVLGSLGGLLAIRLAAGSASRVQWMNVLVPLALTAVLVFGVSLYDAVLGRS